MEWNDLRDEVGTNVGTYDNPRDLTRELVDGDAVLRSTRTRKASSNG